MYRHNMFLKNNHFGTIHRITDFYQECDLTDGSRYTVVVLEDEAGNSIGIAENIVKTKYTVMDASKELKIKSLMMDYKKYKNKYDSIEKAAIEELQETGDHHYHDTFDQMEYWEADLLERAEYLGIKL